MPKQIKTDLKCKVTVKIVAHVFFTFRMLLSLSK